MSKSRKRGGARSVRGAKHQKVIKPSARVDSPPSNDPDIYASAFGSKDFSKAFDQCASGRFADSYRTYFDSEDFANESCEGLIKPRWEKLRATLAKDRIALKILESPVDHALGNWRTSAYPWETELSAPIVVQQALKFARKYGCSAVFPILKDGQGRIIPSSISLEVAMARPGATVDKLVSTTQNLDFQGEPESNFYKPWYGFPRKVKIGTLTFHPSRVALFGNVQEPYFNSIQAPLSDYHESLRRLAIAVRRNLSFILQANFNKTAAIIQASMEVGAGAPTLERITTDRARSLYQNLNDLNIAVVNEGEQVQKFEHNNIDDLIKNVELHMQVLSASSGIPLSVLFTKPVAAGLSNKSDETFLNYSQELDGWRINFVNPGMKMLDDIMEQVTNTTQSSWEWNETKAEELRLKLQESGNQNTPTQGGAG